MKGTVFNIQRFSLYDGPGIRTVVFFKGCPLNCIWCHNPEGKKPDVQIMFAPNKCIGCGECAVVCPSGLHSSDGKVHTFNRRDCIACGKCADACCTDALETAGKDMTCDEVMAEVLRDLPFYSESRGGLTLSGGEPLMQGEFAIELLKKAKDAGISTCVETCGFCDSDVLRKAANYTDIFYYDYKATGDDLHRKLCGAGNELILKNLSLLDDLGAKVVLRCPIVPDANYTDEHICGICETARDHSSVSEIHLEPYHDLGVGKSERLGEASECAYKAPDKRVLNKNCEVIAEISGKPCSIS